ncbi:MAG: type II toxin-antitoxin system RelE/ParE family toxin [Streptosporangiaceae bacterium]
MAEVKFSPAAFQAYEGLEKAGAEHMLDAIDDAVDGLEADPSSASCRRRAFRGGLWGIPIRDPHDDWLIVWEFDPEAADVVRVRYIGADPFA